MTEEIRIRVPEELKDAVAQAARAQGLCASADVRQTVISRLRAERADEQRSAA